MLSISPVTLTGRLVRLEPLALEHAPNLYRSSRDPSLWTWKPVGRPETLSQATDLVASVVAQAAEGVCLPFAIVRLADGRAVGETRYHSFHRHDRNLEIGWTWIAPEVQRTGVNTECKYLLLRHAFEVMGAVRVQFRTHHLNTVSQRALERIGAVREGVLRRHMLMPDGSWRDSVYFSVLDGEWPEVGARLERLRERRAGESGGAGAAETGSIAGSD